MQSYFCLPEVMWVQWLNDETNLIGAQADKLPDLVGLYETALADYHYRKVYKMYLKLLIAWRVEDQGSVFERAISVWGHDASKGDAFWDLYASYVGEDERKASAIVRRRCALSL